MAQPLSGSPVNQKRFPKPLTRLYPLVIPSNTVYLTWHNKHIIYLTVSNQTFAHGLGLEGRARSGKYVKYRIWEVVRLNQLREARV